MSARANKAFGPEAPMRSQDGWAPSRLCRFVGHCRRSASAGGRRALAGHRALLFALGRCSRQAPQIGRLICSRSGKRKTPGASLPLVLRFVRDRYSVVYVGAPFRGRLGLVRTSAIRPLTVNRDSVLMNEVFHSPGPGSTGFLGLSHSRRLGMAL